MDCGYTWMQPGVVVLSSLADTGIFSVASKGTESYAAWKVWEKGLKEGVKGAARLLFDKQYLLY